MCLESRLELISSPSRPNQYANNVLIDGLNWQHFNGDEGLMSTDCHLESCRFMNIFQQNNARRAYIPET